MLPAWGLAAVLALTGPAVVTAGDPPPLVFEGGRDSQFEIADGVLRLRHGSGWVRTRRVYTDFVLTLEFRTADDLTDAGIGIRTLSVPKRWPRSGYRITLTGEGPAGQIVGRRVPVRAISSAVIPRPSPREWHTLLVSAEGSRVTVTIDGIIASVSEIDDFTGSVAFDVRRGSAEFRIPVIRPLPHTTGAYRLGEPGLAGRLVPPKLVKEVRPTYAESAMRRGAKGVVLLEALVREDGSVGSVDIKELPDPELEHSALAALTQWKFRPGLLDGKPVKVIVVIELTFTLR